MKKSILSILGILALAAGANAQVIYQSDFQSDIAGWYWAGTAGSVSQFNVGGGNQTLSLGGASTGGTAHAFLQFTQTTLTDGQTLRLTFDIVQANALGNVPTGIGVILFNTSSSYAANQTTPDIWATGSQGYRILSPTGTDTSSEAEFLNLGGPNDPFAGANNNIAANGSAPAFAGGNQYQLDITRTNGTTFSLTASIGGTTYYNAVDTGTKDYSVFNTLAIGYRTNSTSNRSIRLDNMTLEVVPEPTTWALLAASLTTLMIFRRRRAC